MPSSIIPSQLTEYFEYAITSPSPVLLTSVLETPANWLVLRFILAAIHGTNEDNLRQTRNTSNNAIQTASGNKVVFVSAYRSFEIWSELGKKTALDFSSLIRTKRLSYIDALGAGFLPGAATATSGIITPKSFALTDIGTSIDTALNSLLINNQATEGSTASKIIVVLDGLDLLLATQPDLKTVQALNFITRLQERCDSLVITCAADASLIHNTDGSATALEVNHADFVRSLAHQSSLVTQLRPLETGQAKEVSGTLQISYGGDHPGDEENIREGEWLYQVKGDGSVKVWTRGES